MPRRRQRVVGQRASASRLGPLVYVVVDDLAYALARVPSAGGAVRTPKTAVGPSGASYAVCRDPAGSRVGLHEERAAAR
jgi:predicted enzyme related to lactoylglutathione lyase